MGALRQPRPVEPDRKPPNKETLDKYGRNPNSLAEKLRARTDYATGEGWAPFPHAVWADLPRLSSGAICFAFVGVVNMLSLGRPRKSGAPWHEWTEPISKADLAELCYCDEKGIQRQISELQERGMIGVKSVKNGVVKYSISLLYSKWREIEDYAVWKRRQVVAIDDAIEDEIPEDEDAAVISSDAVQVFKSPAVVRPGRATKAKKLSTSVNSFVFQNDSAVDTSCTAVIQSGCLIVSASSQQKANEKRTQLDTGVQLKSQITERVGLSGKRNKGESIRHPLSDNVVSLFDPILKHYNSRLISADDESLWSACSELGEMPLEFLEVYVKGNGSKKGRASREVSGPKAVIAIIRECHKNWEARAKDCGSKKVSAEDLKADELKRARAVLASPESWQEIDIEWARGVVNAYSS